MKERESTEGVERLRPLHALRASPSCSLGGPVPGSLTRASCFRGAHPSTDPAGMPHQQDDLIVASPVRFGIAAHLHFLDPIDRVLPAGAPVVAKTDRPVACDADDAASAPAPEDPQAHDAGQGEHHGDPRLVLPGETGAHRHAGQQHPDEHGTRRVALDEKRSGWCGAVDSQ
jgi:hypothetical protein